MLIENFMAVAHGKDTVGFYPVNLNRHYQFTGLRNEVATLKSASFSNHSSNTIHEAARSETDRIDTDFRGYKTTVGI